MPRLSRALPVAALVLAAVPFVPGVPLVSAARADGDAAKPPAAAPSDLYEQTDRKKMMSMKLPRAWKAVGGEDVDPKALVTFSGFFGTDTTGRPEMNKVLSERRAERVVDYLAGKRGINHGRLTAVGLGQDVALDGTFGTQHAELQPNIKAANIVLNHPNRNAFVNSFFNTAAFVQPNLVPAGTYGNAGRGLISGPAFNSTDLSVLKDFLVREPWKLQFRAELFNAFNQVNFNNPDTTVTDGTFGVITSANDGRLIQFALKLLW